MSHGRVNGVEDWVGSWTSASLGGRLPAGLGEPLHVLEPAEGLPPIYWIVLVLAVLLVGGLYAFGERLRPRPGPADAGPPEPATLPMATASHGDWLVDLRRRHGRARTYRAGCHELAGRLREIWQPEATVRASPGGGAGNGDTLPPLPPLATLTAGEIAERLEDPAIGRLFSLLERLRFGRREPRERDLHRACEQAADLLRTRAAETAARPPGVTSPVAVAPAARNAPAARTEDPEA